MVLLSWKLSWLQSPSVRNQISSFSTFESRTDGLVWNRHGNHMVLILTITLARADCPWTKTGNCCFNKDRTSERTVVMATAQQVSFCFFCDKHFWYQVWKTLLQDICCSVFFFQRVARDLGCVPLFDRSHPGFSSAWLLAITNSQAKKVWSKVICHHYATPAPH